MQSRMDRYQTSKSKGYERTTKNTELYKKVYDDIYSDTSYKNMSIIDTAKEINIDKLKNILDDTYDNKQYRTLNNYSAEDLSLNDKISYPNTDNDIYDINEIIDRAKSKRAFIEEAKEKQKYLDVIESRNTKYENKYSALKDEEQDIEDLINTMTMPAVNSENDLMADLMGDENTVVTKPVDTDFEISNNTDSLEEQTSTSSMTDKLDKLDKTFYTDSNMLTKNDFEDFSALNKELNKSKIITKVIIIIIILLVIVAAYFGVTKYLLK